MSNLRKIIAWILTFAISIYGLFVPSFAASGSTYEQKVGFWDWAVSGWSPLNDFVGYVFGAGCPKSEDGYHHANTYQVDMQNGYYKCICSYCGHEFTAYESDLKQSYANQVAELPATGYNSAGNLIWQPTIADLNSESYIKFCNTSTLVSSIPTSFYYKTEGSFQVDLYFGQSNSSILFNLVENCLYCCPYFYFVVPVSGSYRIIPSLVCSMSGLKSTGVYISQSKNTTATAFLHFYKGAVYDFNFTCGGVTSSYSVSFGSGSLYMPVFEVVPDTALDTSAGGQYSITTRPTSITGGNYGIVGDDGTINTVTNNNQIVNETNNTYYNPATGTTAPITEWSYDYTDRSYTVTLESGDTYTVTYGDENIVIKEGDTTYNIYYMIDGSGTGGGDPAPTPCVHDWQESSRTEPACTSPGRVVYTCSQCGQTKAETIPALGHDWKVIRTVPTEYDENGVQTQEGYTLYECTRCGEQYKDADSTGPPDGSVNDGGLIEWLNGLIQSLSDNLSGAVDLILRFFQEIPKLFGGFLEFLSAMFPYLPDDIIFLLTFGIAALVFVGVIKAIRR